MEVNILKGPVIGEQVFKFVLGEKGGNLRGKQRLDYCPLGGVGIVRFENEVHSIFLLIISINKVKRKSGNTFCFNFNKYLFLSFIIFCLLMKILKFYQKFAQNEEKVNWSRHFFSFSMFSFFLHSITQIPCW